MCMLDVLMLNANGLSTQNIVHTEGFALLPLGYLVSKVNLISEGSLD